VDGVFNAVVAEGDHVGRTVFEGRGAGAGPTASAVVADLIDIAAGRNGPAFGMPAGRLTRPAAMPVSAREGRYYIRLEVQDRPGVIADIAAILRDERISIESLLQHGRGIDGGGVPVVLVTHEVNEAAMAHALKRMGKLRAVAQPPRMIRIENL
jgi:homoserine dehydrogenase